MSDKRFDMNIVWNNYWTLGCTKIGGFGEGLTKAEQFLYNFFPQIEGSEHLFTEDSLSKYLLVLELVH